MAESITLGYWNIRGLAEKIRLLMEFLKIPYQQVFITPETSNEWFDNLKPQYLAKNPAANLPYLLDGEKVISESDAILVYLCHKANRLDLLGQTADDQVQIATVWGVFKDLQKGFYNYVYGQKPYQEFKQEAQNSLKNHFVKLDGLLGEKQWFASNLTYIDFILGQFFQVYSLFNPNFAEQFPRLKAHQQRLWSLEGVASYLKSDRFKERPINYYPHAKWF